MKNAKKTKTEMMKKVYALYPVYDSRQSFYNKALVYEDDDIIILYSYLQAVLVIDKKTNKYCLNSEIEYDELLSNTTLRHIKELLKQKNISDDFNKKKYDNFIYSNKKLDSYDPSLQRLF